MVSGNEVKKAMDVLGITDVHADFTYVKKVHKKLLLKWHPDSCPEGKTEEYTKRSAEINAAFDVLEKAYKIGMMGPGVKDFRETTSEKADYKTNTSSGSSYTQSNRTSSYNSTNGTNNGSSSKNTNSTTDSSNSKQDNTTNTYSNDYQYTYDTYWNYRYHHKRMNNRYLIHNAVWNFIFYAICFKHIYRIFTETDLEYKIMYIKETPYYFSVLLVVFYVLKLMYLTSVVDIDLLEHLITFSKFYLPIAFVYPIVYTFLHGVKAAIVFSVYLAGWAVFEWLMNIKIYENLDVMSIGTIKGKKVSLPFIFFGLEEVISIVFGIYIAIAAIYIK